MKKERIQLDTLDIKTQEIITLGESIYNSLRNSDIIVYWGKVNGKISLQDKKCLSIYLSLIQSDNFFSKILDELGYKNFPDLSSSDTNDYHYEKEFYEFLNYFDLENYLEVVILYLLDYPIIKQFNLENGNSIWKMKIAVYDYLGNKAKNIANKEISRQKVLTK